MSKTIIQAHEDAVIAIQEALLLSNEDAKAAAQAYLKSMLDDGYAVMRRDDEVTFEELNKSYGKDN
jgi:hypothetical protein